MRSVLIVGFDGLQPAQVTPEKMPNLAAFAVDGVTFQNHHAVFPTVTRTNVVSMLTGRYPGGHGLAANTLVIRDFDPHRLIPALKTELAEVAEATGRVLLVPHLADILGAHGEQYIAVGTGTTGNAYLQNPNAGRVGGATIHPEFCLPEDLHDQIISRFGPWPEEGCPNEERLAHGVKIITEYVLGDRNPLVSLIWFCEPDSSQHEAGVGSELAERALAAADQQFGRLLGWLRENGRDADTDVLVVSDHGYSTATAAVDIEALVVAAGFPPAGEPGGVIVAPNGGSVLFYVHDRDQATADRLVTWLMGQPWCGAVTASGPMSDLAGTLPAAFIGAEGDRAPDVAMSFAWDSRPNAAGFPGHFYNTGKGPGLGNHGSMSIHELRCVLIARGPSFRQGIALSTPSGHVDLAPTVLRTLGIAGGEVMDGRILHEALTDGPAPRSVDWSTEVRRAERTVQGGVYRQQISVSRVGQTVYVDEGNAGLGRA